MAENFTTAQGKLSNHSAGEAVNNFFADFSKKFCMTVHPQLSTVHRQIVVSSTKVDYYLIDQKSDQRKARQ